MASTARKASGTDRRLLAESSRVRSNHWVAAVMAGLHRVHHHVAGQGADTLAAHGVALVGHGGGADLVLFKGLLHLLQVAEQAHVGGKLAGGLGNAGQGGQHACSPSSGNRSGRRPGRTASKPISRAIFRSSSLTFSWSPSNSSRKAGLGAGGALGAQQLQGGQMRCSTSSRSISSSFIHRVARLPTVTSWAGWKWVKPRVGRALYSSANLASACDAPAPACPGPAPVPPA